jgi:glycerophosphoryl diester phosphodiesterase/CubicO group peptidase (beta-lactamase class C family)
MRDLSRRQSQRSLRLEADTGSTSITSPATITTSTARPSFTVVTSTRTRTRRVRYVLGILIGSLVVAVPLLGNIRNTFVFDTLQPHKRKDGDHRTQHDMDALINSPSRVNRTRQKENTPREKSIQRGERKLNSSKSPNKYPSKKDGRTIGISVKNLPTKSVQVESLEEAVSPRKSKANAKAQEEAREGVKTAPLSSQLSENARSTDFSSESTFPSRYVGQHLKTWDTLTQVIQILEANKADYFLMAGSLLGFARSHDKEPWLDSDIDLAISITWMSTGDNLQTLDQKMATAGFVLDNEYTGVDNTVASLGGARVYVKQGIEVELVATEVIDGAQFVNGFRHQHYRLACPTPYSTIQSLPWGSTSLPVRVPMPYVDVLQATYGQGYRNPPGPHEEYGSSRMANVTMSGQCLIVKNVKEEEDKTDRFTRGMVACLTSRQSVADAFVLIMTLNDKWKCSERKSVAVEFFHLGSLSYHLQARLELYPFVTVVDLTTMATGPSSNYTNDAARCHVQALQNTKLRHVLWIQPSIQFLVDPSHILQTAQYVHEKDQKCQSLLTRDGSCITSTSMELASTLLKDRYDPQLMEIVRTHPYRSISTMVLNNTSLVAAQINEVYDRVGLWLHPSPYLHTLVTPDSIRSPGSLRLIRHQASKQALAVPSIYHSALDTYCRFYAEARRFILMDRPIRWVAFDGGLFWQHSTMNSKKAVDKAHAIGVPIQTIDLTLSHDNHLVVTHNDRKWTSFPFEGNNLPSLASNTTAKEIRKWNVTCIPPETIRTWLYDNPYLIHHCTPERVSFMEDFFVYSIDAEIVYDLKGNSGKAQVRQAQMVAELFHDVDDHILASGQVAVRFFDVANDQQLKTAILPDHALTALSSDKRIRNLPFYLNAPSSLACKQLLTWIHSTQSFGNKHVLGCFIIMDHKPTLKSWEEFVDSNKLSLNVNRMPPPKLQTLPPATLICDMPRKQVTPQPSLWQTSHIACIEEGFRYIQHPWQVPMQADFSRLPSGLEEDFSEIQSQLNKSIIPTRLRDTMIGKGEMDPGWNTYVSHWGFTYQSDWENRHTAWFQGASIANRSISPGEEAAVYRCAGKTLVAMLLLRLEELGLVNLDDPVPLVKDGIVDTMTRRPSLRHVLSNRAATLENNTVPRFQYDNFFWKYVPMAVERACRGLNFTNAIQHYILDPMGIDGKFDEDTPYPPYAARGFLGSLDDLLLTAGTLSSRGVSPKTRQRVLSPASVSELLSNTIPGMEDDPVQRLAFQGDKAFRSMTRFRNPRYLSGSNATVPIEVMDGYALGLWCVHGWRRTLQGDPIRGWVALGSSEALLYFDTTGMAVVFLSPTRTMGKELTTAFALVVSDLGDLILERQQATILTQQGKILMQG